MEIKNRGIYKKCLKCTEEFYTYPYQVNDKKYCSKSCRKKGENRECLTCKKIFYALPGQIKRGWGKYCSHKCFTNSRRGVPTWIKGKHIYTGGKKFKSSERSFKGTIQEYKSLHYKIGIRFGKPQKCEHCGKKGVGKEIEWANKSGLYKEELDDWLRLCKKCHWVYDKQFLRMEVGL